jgi:hypothetical protein
MDSVDPDLVAVEARRVSYHEPAAPVIVPTGNTATCRR